jgi:phosphate transport system substrate-binding protein
VRRALLIAVLVGSAAIGFVAIAPVQGQAASRHATISPRNGLLDFTGDGQFATVTWEGFPHKGSVYMRECVRNAHDVATQCSQGGFYSPCGVSCPGTGFLGQSDPRGSGSGVAQIAIGDINTRQNFDPIDGLTFTCDFQHACSVFVMSDPDDLTSAIELPISFAKPATACPVGGTFLSGSGGSAGFRMFLGWAADVCKEPTNLGLQYVLRPARDALQDYVDGVSSYAVSSIPLDNAQAGSLPTDSAFAPVAASGLVFAYRIFDQETGRQITDLTLSPSALARIFTGQVVQWKDDEITELNPDDVFPPFIGTIARGDASEETLLMTRWMWANAREDWIAGGEGSGIDPNPFAVGPTDLLPSLGQVALVTGARKEASVIARGEGDYVSTSTYGLIGYVDSSWAAQYELPTVKIRYDGGTTVAATPATIEAALPTMDMSSQGVLEANVSVQDPHVWPMPAVSYALVPYDAANAEAPPDPDLLAGLKTLLHFGLEEGQKNLARGYVPLPQELGTQASCVAGSIAEADPDQACIPAYGGEAPGSTPGGGHGNGGGGSESPPPAFGGSAFGPGSSPPPTIEPTATATPTPSPTPSTVYVSPTPPPFVLSSSGASSIFPFLLVIGLVCAVLAPSVLYGDRAGRWSSKRLSRFKPGSRGPRGRDGSGGGA